MVALVLNATLDLVGMKADALITTQHFSGQIRHFQHELSQSTLALGVQPPSSRWFLWM